MVLSCMSSFPKTVRSVAQPGSATALGAVGREFESLHSDQFDRRACLGKGKRAFGWYVSR